jgi:hypothetical protein
LVQGVRHKLKLVQGVPHKLKCKRQTYSPFETVIQNLLGKTDENHKGSQSVKADLWAGIRRHTVPCTPKAISSLCERHIE